MTYYFDTDTLARTNRFDLPIDTNQSFWDWLIELGNNGIVRIPEKVYEELGTADDILSNWINEYKRSRVGDRRKMIGPSN